jgi:hypothetical protein
MTACLLLIVGGGPAAAQSGGARQAFQTRFGWFFPSGGGELWDTNEEVFTLSASDFDGFRFGLTYLRAFSNQLEMGVNLDFYSERVFSSYRDWVDEDYYPINHDTRLSSYPLTVDFRFLPGGRYKRRPQGREVVHPVFYLGGGAGINFWSYEEVGDFLDFGFDPPVIFYDRFRDDGSALTVHVLAGVELPVSPRFNVVLEGRHSWSNADLGGSLSGLGTLELGGTSGFFGLSWRF